MIVFAKKVPQPAADEGQGSRFDQIRKAAEEKHRANDREAAKRLAGKTEQDDGSV